MATVGPRLVTITLNVKLALASNMSVAVSVTVASPGYTSVIAKCSPSMLTSTTALSEDTAVSDSISSGSKFPSAKTPSNDNISGP